MTFSRLLKQIADSALPITTDEDLKEKTTALDEAYKILCDMEQTLSAPTGSKVSFISLYCELIRCESLIDIFGSYLKNKSPEQYQPANKKLSEVDKKYQSVILLRDSLFPSEEAKKDVTDRSEVPEWKVVPNPVKCSKL